MRGNRYSMGLKVALAIFTVALFVKSTWAADHETVLYSFQHRYSTDGAYPYTGVIVDAAGNLYGTTVSGGVADQALHQYGTVFELSPSGGGGWTEKLLHTFGKGADGQYPSTALIFDAAGNLYGCTSAGGMYGYGTVFELSPNPGGGWTEAVLYNFPNETNGSPSGNLIFDDVGNLYGLAGGVFELSPNAGGSWTETVLYNFGNGADGQYPTGLMMSRSGNLYGTTFEGGIYNNCYDGTACGTVFELSPDGRGGWTEAVLHSFGNGTDGQSPFAGLIMDGAGNLYGTTNAGGIYNNCNYGPITSCGTAFELSPQLGGGWTETVLHNFGNGTDGQNPESALSSDTAGNLYGTTQDGGLYGNGTVFELSPNPGGGWTETVLHSFNGNGMDGDFPYSAGVIVDTAGNLYGTTVIAGSHGTGAVFEITH
jgi:uncharacterized repeat protein (TIGR03803 family)